MAHEINIDEIEATANTQVRRILDARVIGEYAEAMGAGAIFPPLTVFAEKGSQRYVLADGFHRLEAAKAQSLATFLCEVQIGGVRAALGHALSANDQHGLRRTNADKRNAVELALKDPEWTQWSHADIARLCRVNEKTVARIREDMVLSGGIEARETTKFKRGGKEISRKSTSSASPEIRKQNLSSVAGLKQPKTKAERIAIIKALAKEGCLSTQIAEQVGVQAERVKKLAREEGIELADTQIGRVRKIDSRRVIKATVDDIAASLSALNIIGVSFADIEPSHASEWVSSLVESSKLINRLRKKLSEVANS